MSRGEFSTGLFVSSKPETGALVHKSKTPTSTAHQPFKMEENAMFRIVQADSPSRGLFFC
jgi:hypothetical protein